MAGLNAVDRAVGDGRRIAVIERALIGGTCPTRGCIPTKAMVRSAEVAHQARRGSEFGIQIGSVEVDFPAVMARVRDIIQRGSDGTRRWVESLDGVEIVEGDARFVGPYEVAVGDRALTAPHVVIATGADPGVPPIPGLADVPFWTSDDVLKADTLPERLTIIGAGPIALELGQALGRLGATVTVIEGMPRLLPMVEPELVELLRAQLVSEGIEIITGAAVEEVQPGPAVVINVAGAKRTIVGDGLLVATGRVPAISTLGLEHTAVRQEGRGLAVDENLATGATGIYAAGDVVGTPYGAFTSVARRMGITAAANALNLDPHPADQDLGPTAIFTDPEVAMVGLTEAAAREAGHDVSVATGTFTGGKARAWGEEGGMVKVVLERGTRRILGTQILAYHASDLIHPIAVAMQAPGGTADPVLAAKHVHPTFGEVVQSALKQAAK
jgi:pyruvate/2-oxoglutarate dehydrogenase complex dihydrolipoamide dehydrogenase (E3) component